MVAKGTYSVMFKPTPWIALFPPTAHRLAGNRVTLIPAYTLFLHQITTIRRGRRWLCRAGGSSNGRRGRRGGSGVGS